MALWRDVSRASQPSHTARVEPPDFSALLDAVRGIRWPARLAVRSGIPGAHISRMRGISAEFTEYRPYRQGDDIGRIDWRLFARSDRAYIRLSNDRAILPTTVVLDASESMAFPVATHTKWKFAAQLAVGLAAVARSSADPAGLVIAREGGMVQLPPRTRRGIIHEMIDAVIQTGTGGSEPLAPAVSSAIRTSGRIVIVSDFLGDDDDLLGNAARAVVAGREVHAIHVVAREEIDPPRETLLVADPETPEIRRPLTGDARDIYLKRFAEWREKIAHEWSDAGVSFSLAVAGEEATDHVIRRVTSPRASMA